MGTIVATVFLLLTFTAGAITVISFPQFNQIIACYNKQKIQNEELVFKSRSHIYALSEKDVCKIRQEIIFNLEDCIIQSHESNTILPRRFHSYVENLALLLQPGVKSLVTLKDEHDQECTLYPKTMFQQLE